MPHNAIDDPFFLHRVQRSIFKFNPANDLAGIVCHFLHWKEDLRSAFIGNRTLIRFVNQSHDINLKNKAH